jgi:four helix bundle protein
MESKMAVQSYKDLIVWQKSIVLVTNVYRCTKAFPKDELYGLTSQLRRAAVPVPSNIAEGQGRVSTGEFRQFLGHARGSLHEMQTQLVIAENLGYLGKTEKDRLLEDSTEVDRMLNRLISSLAN